MSVITRATRIVAAVVVSASFMAVVAQPAYAQTEAAQPTTSGSDLYGITGQSNFQNAGNGSYQQNAPTSDITAGGSGSLLQQVTNGTVTVTGAPASSAPASEPSSSIKLWFSIIFVVSAIGLVAMYVYTRRTARQQTAEETQFANELVANIDEEITAEEPKKEESGEASKPKAKGSKKAGKGTKAKKKKKNHR